MTHHICCGMRINFLYFAVTVDIVVVACYISAKITLKYILIAAQMEI